MVRRSDNLLVSVKNANSVEVGDCSYEALQVLTLVDQATEAPLILRHLFLTELGVALPWTRDGEDEPQTEVRLVGLEVEGG
jgi:hypothetical protein